MAVIILILAFVLSLIIELPHHIDRHQKNKAIKNTQPAKHSIVREDK